MSRPAIDIEVCCSSVTAVRALCLLRSELRLKSNVRLLTSPLDEPGPHVLRIEPGSLIRPLLTVLWSDTQTAHGDFDLTAHARMGLSPAVWGPDTDADIWQYTAKPLSSRARYGTPDPRRPWVLVGPGVSTNREMLEASTGLADAQAHFIRPCSASDHRAPVWWLPTRSTLESLLGRVDAVVAPPGPLSWDASRCGVPVFTPKTGAALSTQLANRRLAGVVPGVLAVQRAFWARIAAQFVDGSEPLGWGTIPWLLEARELTADLASAPATISNGFRLKHKLRKLQRDPAGFWADSSFVRRALYARARVRD